jgi:hypothetical protein
MDQKISINQKKSNNQKEQKIKKKGLKNCFLSNTLRHHMPQTHC